MSWISCLTVAGSDSCAGAGIQADMKTFAALGVYGVTAITAITAQDTSTVHAIENCTARMVAMQMEAALNDSLNVRAVKTGMLPNADCVDAVASVLQSRGLPLVVDPVMVSKGGSVLTPNDTIAFMKRRLLPLAMVVTPNLQEAESLSNTQIIDRAGLLRAGATILAESPGLTSVLLKGGHCAFSSAGESGVTDWLLFADGRLIEFSRPRTRTKNCHGTGCTLSAAIAANLALGHPLVTSVREATHYMSEALVAASDVTFGGGHGPLHHFHRFWATNRGIRGQLPGTLCALNLLLEGAAANANRTALVGKLQEWVNEAEAQVSTAHQSLDIRAKLAAFRLCQPLIRDDPTVTSLALRAEEIETLLRGSSSDPIGEQCRGPIGNCFEDLFQALPD